MTTPKLTYLPDILEEHFEELQFLWGQRRAAIRSPLYTMRELADLEERIDAHVAGLLVYGDRMIPVAEQGLAGEDELPAFAAAYPLLCLHTAPARARVLEAFASGDGKRLDGLRQAMCQGPVTEILPKLEEFFSSAPAPVSAAAAEALAFHSVFAPTAEQLSPFLRDERPSVRQSGWRLVSYLAVPVEPKTYAAAMRDEDEGVRRAAVAAAAWSGVPGILALARQFAEKPTKDHLALFEVLAALGAPDDLPRVTALARAAELGPARLALVGTYGHPVLVELLLAEMTSPDPATAAAAGDAFTKMTGRDVESGARSPVPPPDGGEPDAFEAEFLDVVTLPDPELARRHWEELKPRFLGTSRMCRGFDLSRGMDRDAFAKLDMASRWELCLRSRYQGAWQGSPMNLEVFPQRS